ncbi:MAG: hypothetical protein ACOC1U_02505 [Spirochaetota bacterium]
MRFRAMAVVGALALVSACATLPGLPPAASGSAAPPRSVADPGELTRDLSPRDGQAVFLGVAHRLRERGDERSVAIRHAAEQASRYMRLGARYRLLTARDAGRTNTLDDVITQWDEAAVGALMDDVDVLEEYVDQDGTYILATVRGVPGPPAAVAGWPGTRGGEPAWIRRPPALEGFLAAVGASQRRRDFRDSLDFADQAALTEILLQSGASIRMLNESQTVENVGTREQVTATQEASTVLRGFYVVARYISENGRTVYSLAVAREE